MDESPLQTPPQSPREIDKILNTPGSPNPVPSSPDQENEIENSLSRGFSSAGGSDGNKYQVMWITLACINAIYQSPKTASKLNEIILEGKRHPFDDVEIRKTNGRMTLFQSKHRNIKGCDNIRLPLLVVDPDKPGNDSDAFSLLKYFRGMMSLIHSEPALKNANFILCVSAPFSTRSDKEKINLGTTFWDSRDVLQPIEIDESEPLLRSMYLSDKSHKSISDHLLTLEVKSPRYVRFSDSFINDKWIDEGKKLRDYLYRNLKAFIDRERTAKATWVTWQKEDNDKKLKFFFENLQFWLDQPKVEKLQDIIGEALRINFALGAADIQTSLVITFEKSAKGSQKSLQLKDVEYFLRQARGNILSKYLGAMADQFSEKHLLRSFHSIDIKSKKLITFLNSKNQVCIYTTPAPLHSALKFRAYCTIFNHFVAAKKIFQENWFIVDSQTKPLFHFDEGSKQHIDHEPQDILESPTTELIIIDNAHVYLSSDYGKKTLKVLLERLEQKPLIKLVLISPDGQKWKELFESYIFSSYVSTKISYNVIPLKLEQVRAMLIAVNAPEQCIEFFTHQFIPFTLIMKEVYPGFLQAFTEPNTLVEALKNRKAASNNVPLPEEKNKVKYKKLPLPCYVPVYQLKQVCELIEKGEIRLSHAKPDCEENLKELTGLKWKYDKNNKCYIYSKLADNQTIKLELSDGTDLNNVIVASTNDDLQTRLIKTKPVGFKILQITTNTSQILLKNTLPQRLLIAADYGSGKSALLSYLVNLALTYQDNSYEIVSIVKLPKIVKKIKKGLSLVDIIAAQAKKNGLVKHRLEAWQKCILQSSVNNGSLFLLCDGWDELKGEDVQVVNDWLSKLPSSLSFAVCSRPHAESNLAIPFHQKISLPSFDWKTIREYINEYFPCPSESEKEKHDSFLKKILTWLGNGKNSDAIEILQRPLHTKLLCEALQYHYDQYMAAIDEAALAEVEKKAPWNDQVLYRTKLYQLIVIEQFRTYLSRHVKVQDNTYLTETWRMSMLTQTLQIRLREIAFHKIFNLEPIRIAHHFDTKQLDDELDHLGFINHHGEAEHRIFIEYYAAEYLLFGLTRNSDDFYYKHVMALINKYHSDRKFDQVWRILGEMIRYGNPFLTFPAKGADVDVFQVMQSQFDDGDKVTAHRRFFKNCLNGKPFNVDEDAINFLDEKWFFDDKPKKIKVGEVKKNQESLYQGQDPESLLITANKIKNSAANIVKYLAETEQLNEQWLMGFYMDKSIRIELKRNITCLRLLVDKGSWPENAWGGYWDVDAYLPSLCHMKSKLFVVAAAYFIHRIENKNYIYYSNGIPQAAVNILTSLASSEFDNSSNFFFLMMVQTWLRKTYILNQQTPTAIIPNILNKAFKCFKDEKEHAWLGADVIFSIAFAFRLPITITNDNQLEVHFPSAPKINSLTLEFSSKDEKKYLLDRFRLLYEKCDFCDMKLPDVEWEGPALKQKEILSPAKLIANLDSPTHSTSGKIKPYENKEQKIPELKKETSKLTKNNS